MASRPCETNAWRHYRIGLRLGITASADEPQSEWPNGNKKKTHSVTNETTKRSNLMIVITKGCRSIVSFAPNRLTFLIVKEIRNHE
jgi:hypothetical protein